MQEQWRPVHGFSGYEVSSLGRVRSRRVKHPHQAGLLTETPRIMKGWLMVGHSVSYLCVLLTADDRRKRRRPVHHLVLEAFIGPRPDGFWGLHCDGDSMNNAAGNLRWGTPKENASDRTTHGRTLFGVKNHKAKMTPSAVECVRRDYSAGRATQCELAVRYGISQDSISAIVLGKTWNKSGQAAIAKVRG